MEKIAVVAPMPNASISTAVTVNPGDLRSWRNANLRSGNNERLHKASSDTVVRPTRHSQCISNSLPFLNPVLYQGPQQQKFDDSRKVDVTWDKNRQP